MTRSEYLLVCLLEELGEAAQAVSKGLRFGLGSFHPADPTTDNADLISHELNDVLAVAKMLQADNDLRHIADRRMIQNKQARLHEYLLRNHSYAYRMGYDCGLNGPTLNNYYTIFSSPANTAAWERGRKEAEAVKASVEGKPATSMEVDHEPTGSR